MSENHAYCVLLKKQKFFILEIEEIIRPSLSFPSGDGSKIPKKIDYWALNAKTHLSAFPVQNIPK